MNGDDPFASNLNLSMSHLKLMRMDWFSHCDRTSRVDGAMPMTDCDTRV